MPHLIDKDALVAEIERRIEHNTEWKDACKTLAVLAANQAIEEDKKILSIINTLEVKEVDLITHTIIAECCDWLAMNTNLSHDEIEGCRNLMLNVKVEQYKAQKGEAYDRQRENP